MTTPTPSDPMPDAASRSPAGARGALWCSAFILAALLLLQLGAGRGVPAAASTVASIGDITALSASITLDEQVVCVLDARAEKLLVYRVQNRNRIDLAHALDLPQAFTEAKGGGGAPRQRR